MKVLNWLPFYCKVIGIITSVIGVIVFFGMFGTRVFGLIPDDLGIAIVLISFLLFVLSKERGGVDTTTNKMQSLVYAILINTALLAIANIVTATSGFVFNIVTSLYVNAVSVFVIYLIIYYMALGIRR